MDWVLGDMMTEILMATDDIVVSTASPLTNENILEKVTIEVTEADDSLDDESGGEVAISNVSEVEVALEILRNFSAFIEKDEIE